MLNLSLCAPGLNLISQTRVLAGIEENSFIALPGKRGTHPPAPKNCSNLEGFDEFYSTDSRVVLLIRLWCVCACSPLFWSQVIFLMSFFGYFNVTSGSFPLV